MARYYYYIILMNMSLNIILNVPMVLIQNRFNGSITSILISIPLGTLLAYLFTKGMGRFPYQGLPEIFKEVMPGYIRVPFLFFLSLMWLAAGTLAVNSFSYVIKLYLNPEMDLRIISGFLILLLIFGATRNTQSILYKTEITMLAALPFVGFIIFKTLSSDYFYPVHIKRILQFTWQMPNYSSIAAASYIFTGYINLAIINRNVQAKEILKYFWIIPVLGSLILAFTYLIPFGFLGIQSMGDFVFPWMVTSDSLRMQYGFIERTSFVLVFVFMLVTMLFGIVTWNVGLELMKGAFGIQDRKTGMRLFTLTFLSIIGFLSVYFQESVNQREFFGYAKYWFNLRLPVEVVLVMVVFLLSLRRKKT
ncbi:GerAB/ArcD/ProY family transporter [Peribacillus sp. NPDC056705]|uniref:GerAB/ArcD/ProY family transporter n=2 Tax=Peribacillus TaxID=2675229 RepID=UPI003748D0F6